MPFSPNEEVLFGLDSDIGIHATSLELAKKLFALRKDLERNKTSLKTLSVSEFSRRATLKSHFTQNVERFATKQDRSNALYPFEGVHRTDLFILTCITLTETAHKFLEEYHFGHRFPEFCARVIGDFEISPLLRKRLINDVEVICRQHNSPETVALLGIGSDVERPPSTSSVQASLNSSAPVASRSALVHPPKRKEHLFLGRDPAKPRWQDMQCNTSHQGVGI
jgi:hypothetical protein